MRLSFFRGRENASFPKTLAFVAAVTAGATILSQIVTGADVRRTYESLSKPSWAPPGAMVLPVALWCGFATLLTHEVRP